MEDAYWGTKGKCDPAVQARYLMMVLMKKSRDYWKSKNEISGQWMMIFLRLNPGTSSYMIMKLTSDRWGHSGYKSYALKNLKQTVINKIVHAV